MRNLVLPLLIVTSLGVSSVAMAADLTATGPIKALDAKACTVTLDTDTVYTFAPKCDFSKLKVGEKVTITYAKQGTVDEASKVVAAQ